ncbi:MAG: putative CoA-binding protein [Halobacteriales archaeon]|jgi:predicted CoA-binding protein
MPVTSDEAIRRILTTAETLAVVGCSGAPGKPAHDVPRYMLDHGYEVLPVNPNREEALGRPAVDSLSAIDLGIDLVNVFRPSEEVAGIVEETRSRRDEPGIWTQRGIQDREATDRAEEAGLTVVEDRCLKVEHDRLVG